MCICHSQYIINYGGIHIGTYLANNYEKAYSGCRFQSGLWRYCIKILIRAKKIPNTVNRDAPHVNNGSRQMVAGLRLGCYYTLLVYKLFLQITYFETQVSLRFKVTFANK